MFILGNFIYAFAYVLDIALTILYWLILIRALISWVSPDPSNPIVQFLYKSTEPFLEPVRRMIPFWNMTIDISPIIAFLIIFFSRMFIVKTLMEIAIRIKG